MIYLKNMYIVNKTKDEQILINQCKVKMLKKRPDLKAIHDHTLIVELMKMYIKGDLDGK